MLTISVTCIAYHIPQFITIMIFSLHTEPYGLALDIVNRRLYYSDVTDDHIFYTPMDLNGPATAIPGTSFTRFKARQLAYSRQAK